MGHDITASKDKTGTKEIAYLRAGMSNKEIIKVYAALNTGHCYGGVSGLGMTVKYTLPAIRQAKELLMPYDGYIKEYAIPFLDKILESNNKTIYISFC